MFILLKEKIKIKIDDNEAQTLADMLCATTRPTFIKFRKSNRVINSFDVIGIFTNSDIENSENAKKQNWKCVAGTWHKRNEECMCKAGQANKGTNCDYCDGKAHIESPRGMKPCPECNNQNNNIEHEPKKG